MPLCGGDLFDAFLLLGGVGEAYWNAVTNGTKKEGTTKVSSASSTTEPSTMTLDTKYTSNVWTGQTQSTSSWGDCSMFAIKQELKKQRKQYLVQNLEEIKIEMARGAGEHLKVLTFYSACSKNAYPSFSRTIQRDFGKFVNMKNDNSINKFVEHIDSMIKNTKSIQKNCYLI